MNESVISLAELNRRLPTSLSPVEQLDERMRSDTLSAKSARLSAFPRFATSIADLEEWIDRAPPEAIAGYQQAFRDLVFGMAKDAQCFFHSGYYSDDPRVEALDCRNISASVAAGLSEDSCVDIFVPQYGLALIGHDDFGCHLLYDAEEQSLPWIGRHAAKCGLHIVAIPRKAPKSA